MPNSAPPSPFTASFTPNLVLDESVSGERCYKVLPREKFTVGKTGRFRKSRPIRASFRDPAPTPNFDCFTCAKCMFASEKTELSTPPCDRQQVVGRFHVFAVATLFDSRLAPGALHDKGSLSRV
jgi:hypothetical protein